MHARHHRGVYAALAFSLTVTLVQAGSPLPTDMTVISGNANVQTQGSSMQIETSPNTILNWQSFSIGEGYGVHFQQQSTQSQVVNRVLGNDPSAILGNLSSNGRVWLLNPNGILFGANARVDVGGLVASTLRLDDADFASGRYALNGDPNSDAGIVNHGHISSAYGGQLFLIAPSVRNDGELSAPGGDIALLASDAVELVDSALPTLSFRVPMADGELVNTGSVQAQQVDLYGGVVNQQGLVRADSVMTDAQGRIVLSASKALDISGRVDASSAQGQGGQIDLQGPVILVRDGAVIDASGASGGGRISTIVPADGVALSKRFTLAPGARLSADATQSGKGGSIWLWASDVLGVGGLVTARGGVLGGDGGFIETSGLGALVIINAPDASATRGRPGTWLIDPYDISITGFDVGAEAFDISPDGSSYTSTGVSTSCTGCQGANLYAPLVRQALISGTDVTITTGGGGTGPGNIYVTDSIDVCIYNSNSPVCTGSDFEATLTLQAHGSIFIQGAIRAGGAFTLNLILSPDFDGSGPVDPAFPDLTLLRGEINLNGGELQVNRLLQLDLTASIRNATVTGGAFPAQATMVYGFCYDDPNCHPQYGATLDHVTLGPNFSLSVPGDGSLSVYGDLNLDGATIHLSPDGGNSSIRFETAPDAPAAGITGTGTIVSGSEDHDSGASIFAINDGMFFVAPGIEIQNLAGSLDLAGISDLQGTIRNTAVNGRLSVRGALDTSGTSWVQMPWRISDGGQIINGPTGEITLSGPWTNDGLIDIAGGTLTLHSRFTYNDERSTLGTIERDGGRIVLGHDTIWDLGDADFDLSSNTLLSPLTIAGGVQIINGRFLGTTPLLVPTGSNIVFERITFGPGFEVQVDTGAQMTVAGVRMESGSVIKLSTLGIPSPPLNIAIGGILIFGVPPGGGWTSSLSGIGEIRGVVLDPQQQNGYVAGIAAIIGETIPAADPDDPATLVPVIIQPNISVIAEENGLWIVGLTSNQGVLRALVGASLSVPLLDDDAIEPIPPWINEGRVEALGGEVTLDLLESNTSEGSMIADDGGTLVINGGAGWDNEGYIHSTDNASFTATALTSNSGDLVADGEGSLSISGTAWTNDVGGTAQTDSGGSMLLSGLSSNAGTLHALSGVITIADAPLNGITNTGIIRVEEGAEIFAVDGLNNAVGGRIGGYGTINLRSSPDDTDPITYSALRNAGTVAPGGSIGTLYILGNYVQTEDGVLEIEIDEVDDAIQYDVLDVSGSASLDGTLLVTKLSPFIVSPPEVMPVLIAAGGVTGTFAEEILPSELSVNYELAQVELVAEQAGPPPIIGGPLQPVPPPENPPPVEPPPVDPPPVNPPPVDPPPVDPPPVDPPPVDPPPVDPPPVDPPPVDPPPVDPPPPTPGPVAIDTREVEKAVVANLEAQGGTVHMPENPVGLVVDAIKPSDFDRLLTQAGMQPEDRNQQTLLTDGAMTVFRDLPVEALGREGVGSVLDVRRDIKEALFAEAVQQLEDNPQLANVRSCTTLQESESGRCLLGKDLLKKARAARRAAHTARVPTSAAVPAIARKRALMIGLNQYRDTRIPQLTSALPDARAVQEELMTRLGYEVTLLANASKADIVRWLNRIAIEMDPADSLVIYFAGHGEVVEKTGFGYWIPSDASSRDARTWLSNEDVAGWLGLVDSKQVALIIDSCYSGSFADKAEIHVEGDAQNPDRYLTRRTVAVMTSGSDEPVADTGRDGHSVFASNLIGQLKALEQWTPGAEVFVSVRNQVERELPQTPRYGPALSAGHQSGGDFLFERRSFAP